MNISKNDSSVLRELGKAYAEIANLPIQQEKVRLWKKLNGLKPERPMVTIDQLPVNELASPGDGLLDCKCEDALLRRIEYNMRLDILRWKNYGGDMVLLPQVRCPMGATVTGGFHGLGVTERLKVDETNDVAAQHYDDVIKNDDDLEKITEPVVSLDERTANARMAALKEIFDGILEVTAGKTVMSFNIWDGMSGLKGVEVLLNDIIDRPDFIHRFVDKMYKVYRSTYEQYQRLGLLDAYPIYVHCTGAFTDELPKPGYDGTARACDTWVYAMAQMFSTVSPAMDKEFQLDYAEKYLADVGLIYYGCCEPLHDRIHLIMKQLKNVRKISVSPWANVKMAAERLGSNAVMSRKPNPAYLAFDSFDEDAVRSELVETLRVCREHGTPCELILKDVSTVKYQPDRLKRWNEIAMELVTG